MPHQDKYDNMTKVAIVTGGASGIGLASGRLLALKGWIVVVVDLNVTAGETAARELKGSFYEANVAEYESIASVFMQVWKRYKQVDLVYANAGTVEKSNFYKRQEPNNNGIPPPIDTKVIDINLKSAIYSAYLSQYFFQKNLTSGGCLLFTASGMGLYPGYFIPVYASSKHGVVGLVRSIARNMIQDEIRVNCICPGIIRTPVLSDEEWATYPQDMFTPVEKVAEAVLKVVEDATINGQALEVSGDNIYLRGNPEIEDELMDRAVNGLVAGEIKLGDM